MADKVLRITKGIRYATIFIFVGFCVLLVGVVTLLNLKNNADSQKLLEESVNSQILSICVAARNIIDIDAFTAYDADFDPDGDEGYLAIQASLKALAAGTGAEYIYALKEVDGRYVFIFDTDPEGCDYYLEYDISGVHAGAFKGFEVVNVMNVVDEYGSFNTGAVPLFVGGQVAGIVSVDTDDTLLRQNESSTRMNAILLISAISFMLLIMLGLFTLLLKRITAMQDELTHMAQYDKLTNLPNRQYLMDYLPKISRGEKPYALFFIDLDNFKLVNDTAGHDAGDALLLNIGTFLSSLGDSADAGESHVFRPSAGAINVAARVGGDEFILIAPGISSGEEASAFAATLLEDFYKRDIDKHIEKYSVGLSIGGALYPYHTDNYHVLLKYADIAMYHAKNAGKNTFRFYYEEMTEKPGK